MLLFILAMNSILPKTRLIPRTRRVERQHAQESIAHLKAVGYRRFQISAARDGWDCPACAALHGAVFSVDDPPQLPPADCRCRPYGCRLVVSACREDAAHLARVRETGGQN